MPRNRSEKETPEDAKWRTYLVAQHVYKISGDLTDDFRKTWNALTPAQCARAHSLNGADKLVDLAREAHDATQQK